MKDSYMTVAFSLTSSAVLLCLILFYTLIYPKRKIKPFSLLILLSLLPILSIFRLGAYESGDFTIHVYRSMAFFDAIKDGQLLPSWPADLNATYGYPLFIWLNALPYYVISFIHLFGPGFILSTKFYLALAYILSGISFWTFIKHSTKNSYASLIGSILYLFAPYHFVDLHFRGAIGETLSFAILPLFLLGIQLLVEKKTFYQATVLGLIWGAFILTHQAIAVFSLGLGSAYLFFLLINTHKDKGKTLTLFLLSLISGFALSLYVWLPHIVMSKYTYGYLLTSPMVSFPQIRDLIFSPYRYGFLFQGPNGELSFAIGYTHLLGIVLGLFMLLKRKGLRKKHSFLLFYVVAALGLLFLMQPPSSFIWNAVPLIKSAQFATRLMVLMVFTTSALGGYVTKELNIQKLSIYLLIALTMGISILNWGHRRVIPEITDKTLRVQLWQSTAAGEGFGGLGRPRWTSGDKAWFSEKPKAHLEIIEGSGETQLIRRTSITHEYVVHASTKLLVRENTLYFPGWKAYLNDIPTTISPTTSLDKGLMTVILKKGLWKLTFVYRDIPVLSLAKTLSITTLLLMVVYFVSNYLRERVHHSDNIFKLSLRHTHKKRKRK